MQLKRWWLAQSNHCLELCMFRWVIAGAESVCQRWSAVVGRNHLVGACICRTVCTYCFNDIRHRPARRLGIDWIFHHFADDTSTGMNSEDNRHRTDA